MLLLSAMQLHPHCEGWPRLRRRWNDNGLLSAALGYAALGIPVLPGHYPGTPSRTGRRPGTVCSCAKLGCLHPSEHPMVGLEQATTDPALLEQWWLEAPRANVVLASGVRFDVLDAGDVPGEAIARRLAGTGWQGPLARTGGGRWHLYLSPALSGTTLLRPTERNPGRQLYLHGTGGYVIAPPSRHVTGVSGRWIRPIAVPVPRLPVPLESLLGDPARPAPGRRPAFGLGSGSLAARRVEG
jgi:Bifunctional DNA primase/polymerase, N-terminal